MLFVICFALLFLPVRIFFPTKVIGKKNLPKGGGWVAACNHTSNWDPIVLDILLVKKMRFLAKKELFKNKFGGWFLKKMGAYPVDRDKPEISAVRFALSSLKEGKVLGIFPEGTRNKNPEEKQLLDLKSGAVTFASKGETFIIPMVMYNKVKAFRKNYLIIGEPLKIEGSDPKRLTHEEIDANTARLADEMEKLRLQIQELINRRKHGKKQSTNK